MKWHRGDIVVHGTKPEWGAGKVVEVSTVEVSVFFVEGGRRTFGLPAAFLGSAPPDVSGDALLDNLDAEAAKGDPNFLTLSQCIRRFEGLFPGGFEDSRYLSQSADTGERHYKVVASEFAGRLLNAEEWQSLSAAGRHSEICERLAAIDSKTNLLHPFEKIKWHTALKTPSDQRALADTLYREIHEVDHRREHFDALCTVLSRMDGCAKWTIATYYGFLLRPSSRIFFKPEVTKSAARSCGWDIEYRSALNWSTLQRVEGMAHYLFSELTRRGLRPRDMIDVQSFIWCVSPGSYS